MNDKKKILLFTDWYEPGYKAGGPIRSCVNFVNAMRGEYEIYVFTSDRDLGSTAPYPGIGVDEWISGDGNGAAHFYYASPGRLTWKNIKRRLREISPDFVYLNSMFSPKFTIFPLLIARLGGFDGTIILSPRGMLKDSAIRFKSAKKRLFLHLLRLHGLHRRIRFHAVDDQEVQDIRLHFGSGASVTRIANFPALIAREPSAPAKRPGELSMIYVGRIHPIKNLDYLLDVLRMTRSNVRLTVVGGLEDRTFWEKCRKTIAALPASVHVDYIGEKPNEELPEITAGHHIFALPTKGENFGHAIFEALALGRPVLISDQTPWRDLEAARAGWDLPLGKPERFLQAIEQASAFDQQQYDAWSRATRQYVRRYADSLNLKEEYSKLFS